MIPIPDIDDGGRRALRAAGAALAVLLLSGAAAACGSDAGAEDERLRVVASFYPLAEAATVVGGEFVTVENLTPPGVEPHDLELTADDLEDLATADLVLYVGGEFQPAVEDGLDATGSRDRHVVDALGAALATGSPGHAPPSTDPHFWLDPDRYATLASAVAAALGELDPVHDSVYRTNVNAFLGELNELDRDFSDGLATCDRRLMVVNHAAFGYLADAYGLVQVAISGLSPEAEPDPARLAELRALVEDEGVTTILTEELASPEVAETLAEEANVDVAVLDPLEGLTEDEVEAGEDYVSVMRRNLDVLRSALGCA